MMSTFEINAIDVHAHYGMSKGNACELTDRFMSAGADEVAMLARLAHTELTVVSPLLALGPETGSDPISGNIDAAEAVGDADGLLHWVVVDPCRPDTYTQAQEMLKLPKCAGIKIHPEEHGYPITDYGREIFEFAASRGAVIQSHSGQQKSLPSDFVQFADDFPEVTLILSHLGFGLDGDVSHQVRAIQKSRHGNICTDTSSAKSIIPNLIEWAVREVGAEHILYGTDSPLYYAPMQRARIDYAKISDKEKHLILRENAVRLLKIPQCCAVADKGAISYGSFDRE